MELDATEMRKRFRALLREGEDVSSEEGLEGAVSWAHRALALLRDTSEEVSHSPHFQETLRGVEERLNAANISDKEYGVGRLKKFLSSFAVTPRSFLYVIENAPDQNLSDRLNDRPFVMDRDFPALSDLMETIRSGSVFHVGKYWKRIVSQKSMNLPAIMPQLFQRETQPDQDRWDLYEEHTHQALSLAENALKALDFRKACLGAVWNGALPPSRIPSIIWAKNFLRTLRLARKEPNLVWPVASGMMTVVAQGNTALAEALLETALNHIVSDKLDADNREVLIDLILSGDLLPNTWDRLMEAWTQSEVLRQRLSEAVKKHDYLKRKLQAFLAKNNPESQVSAEWTHSAVQRQTILSLLKRLMTTAEILNVQGLKPLIQHIEAATPAPEKKFHLVSEDREAGEDKAPETFQSALNFVAAESAQASGLRAIGAEAEASDNDRLRLVSDLASILKSLQDYGLCLEAAFVGDLLTAVLKHFVLCGESDLSITSPAILNVLQPLFSLNWDAAAATWIRTTDLPVPSIVVTPKISLSAAVGLVRWVADREKEDFDRFRMSSVLAWERKRDLMKSLPHVPRENAADWWRQRLEQDFPESFEVLSKCAWENGCPPRWRTHAHGPSELVGELYAHANGPLVGARALAQKVLKILFTSPVQVK